MAYVAVLLALLLLTTLSLALLSTVGLQRAAMSNGVPGLQADYLAGVWAHHNRQYLEHGDIEEAMRAANQIGDDAIQRRTQGRVVPHAFTHGSSEQRMRWFNKGLQSGRIEDGDTFAVSYENL